MRVLITGGNGQLGSMLMQLLAEKQCILGEIDAIYKDCAVACTNKTTLDITNLWDIKNCFMKFKPHVVINTAAYTHVDHCESNIDLCFKANSLGPRNLAIACEEIQAKLIHISTDYVFDGKSNIPYREFDLPNPINIYGKSKALGEEYVKQFCSRYFIIRTSWLYGYEGKNFVKTVVKAAKEKKLLHVVADQIGTPTNVEDLAYHLLQLAVTDEYGIYHCTGGGECSWYEFAKAITEYAQIECMIHPISSQDYDSIAQRPLYSTLDHMMLRCTIGDHMRDWKEALKEFILNLK
ncbi:dTDP-4-dehydrorhamnose reductase [Anaerosolibacter carboniphilus]|uniref:dTDP-4-dehydrorhamnose reductase n=1 Tax=Anaerosolibacter carboniphilus TaxID=1417629 RepID=A0A841L013_9FIRM|nr:dTDP-4-dehydrorhamnose reductase [Anaerosolibacter carboniphilus]MBB6215725.1 dTDP-4-dehydrorhamnose reductase [Anaerosolibacter carboniphilus]